MATKYDTSAYDKMYNEFATQQNETAAKQVKQTEADYNQRLREAYISRMQNQQALNNNMTNMGIRGGASETATLKNDINYQSNRNQINTGKTQAVQDIYDNANANILNYKQTNDAAKQAYIEQREAEARQIAQSEKETKDTRAYEEKVNFYTAKYGKYYSVSDLQKAYKKAKTTLEKTMINERIGYLRAHKNGY